MASEQAEEVSGVEQDLTNTPAYVVLNELLADGKISASQGEKYKRKLQRLHEGIILTYQNDNKLLTQAKKLKEELAQQKEKLRKASSLSYEDTTIIGNLRRDLVKAQTEMSMCRDREDAEALEIAQLEKKRNELDEAVKNIKKRKADELEPQIIYLGKLTEEMRNELATRKELIERFEKERLELDQRVVELTQEKETLLERIADLKQGFVRLKGEPEKYKKQASVVQQAAHNLEVEVQKLRDQNLELDATINAQKRRTKEVSDAVAESAAQYEKYSGLVEERDKEVSTFAAALEEAKAECEHMRRERARMESETLALDFTIRRKEEGRVALERERERAVKRLRRAQFQYDQVQRSLPELSGKKAEALREVELQRATNRKQAEALESLRGDVSISMLTLLDQEDVQESRAAELLRLKSEREAMEEELSVLARQVHELSRTVGDLSTEREAKAHDQAKAIAKLREATEEIKVKDLVIFDLSKQSADTSGRLKEFEALYETVKSERAKYMAQIQEAKLASAEHKELIKMAASQIDMLRADNYTKEKAIAKERREHQAACTARDAARSELNKVNYILRQKEEVGEQHDAEQAKLNAIIATLETELEAHRTRFEGAVQDRNYTGIQLINRNGELAYRYTELHHYEEYLRTGDVELAKRDEEIRMLRLKLAEVQREVELTKKQLPMIPKLEQERDSLLPQLEEVRKQLEELTKRAESPANRDRWRPLDGITKKSWEDDDGRVSIVELENKRAELENKCAALEKKIQEKQLVIDDVINMTTKLHAQEEDGRKQALAIAKKMNKYKAKVGELNRKIMAVVSELSIAQAHKANMEKDLADLAAELKEGRIRVDRGEPPTIDAEKTWRRTEKEMKLSFVERLYKQGLRLPPDDDEFAEEIAFFEKQLHAHVPGTTTAEERATHYVAADELGLPVPYGAHAPFRPSMAGAAMRHFRKPAPKDPLLLEDVHSAEEGGSVDSHYFA